MAHKKGVGSSKNGRESASQRLGVKIGAVRDVKPVISSYVSVVQFTTQALTSAWVATTLYTHWLTAS